MLKSYLAPNRVKVVGFTNGKGRYEEGSVIGNVLFIQDFMTLDFLKKFLSAYYNESIKLCKGDKWMEQELLDAYTANWHDATVPVTSKEFKEAKARGFLPDHMEKWTNDHSGDPDTFYVSLWEMTFEEGFEYYSGRQIPVLFGVGDSDICRTSFTPQALCRWGFNWKSLLPQADLLTEESDDVSSYFCIGSWKGVTPGNPWNHSGLGYVEGNDAFGNAWQEKMRDVSKEEYMEIYHALLQEHSSNNGEYSLRDILTGEEAFDKILPTVEEWLDERCSNGHFSRWTSFGNWIDSEAEKMVEELYQELNSREYLFS